MRISDWSSDVCSSDLFTFIHRNAAAGNGAAIRIRGGADYTFANGLITTGASCLRVDSATTVQPANPALDENGPPVFQSVSMQCNDRPLDRKSTRLNSSH